MSHSDYEYGYAEDDDDLDAGKRQSWTAEEDRMLKDMVKQFGPRKWGTIANQFGNRNAKQCHQRFVSTSSFQEGTSRRMIACSRELCFCWLYAGGTTSSSLA